MRERVAQRASTTHKWSALDEGGELARHSVSRVSGYLENVEQGEIVLNYPQFSPSDAESIAVKIEDELNSLALSSVINIEFDLAALQQLKLSIKDLIFFARVRDTVSAWSNVGPIKAIDSNDKNEITFELPLHRILPRGSTVNSEVAIDILSKKSPQGLANWTPSVKLSAFCIQHGDREAQVDFPPIWRSPEEFRNELKLPEETLAYFEPGSMDENVSIASLYVNTEYRDEILGAAGAGGGVSRSFISYAKGEIIEASLLNEDFDLATEYESGTVGAAIQGLLKSERHRVNIDGLAVFRDGRKPEDVHSLARLCACMGKSEIRKLLR